MINSFEHHPEFLTRDFRHNRPSNIGVVTDSAITVTKHQLLLPPASIQGLHVLDIGSFIGQTGDWCLTNGAASYTGVEISAEFAATSVELLQKYHDGRTWNIINSGLEDYFAKHHDKFDVIFCWGVIFGHPDHVWLLTQMAQRADHVVVESRHPKLMWNQHAHILPEEFWHALEYDIAYAEWQGGDMTMLASVNGSIKCTAANSSLATLRMIMEVNGFRADIEVYEKLKIRFPNTFGMFRDADRIGRFVVEFFKDDRVRCHSLTEVAFKDTAMWKDNYISWAKK
jgi:hypothetical protein